MKFDISKSCEDSNKTYITFPDGLRIILENGQYIGWYECGQPAEDEMP